MRSKERFFCAVGMLAASGSAYADAPAPAVVTVRYTVSEQLPERLETMVLNPLERMLVALPRVAELTSIAGHGYVSFAIHFDGGATEQDREAVSQGVEELALDRELVVTSRTVRLASPP